MEERYFERKISFKESIRNISWALQNVFNVAPIILVVIIIMTIAEGLGPAIAIYATTNLVDAVIDIAGKGKEGFLDVIPWLILLATGLILSQDIWGQFREPFFLRLRQKIQFRIEKIILEKAAKLPLLFYENNQSLNKLERSNNPGEKIDNITFYLFDLVRLIISITSIILLFRSVSLWLCLLFIIVMIIPAIYEIKYSKRWMDFMYDQTEEQRQLNYLDRLLTGRIEQKELRVFNLSKTLTERWKSLRKTQRTKAMKTKMKLEISRQPSVLLLYTVEIGVAFFLAINLDNHIITVGSFVALFQAVDRLLFSGLNLGATIGLIQTSSIDIGYVREFLNQEEEKEELSNKVKFPESIKSGIKIENVTFLYPGRDQPILKNINLHIKPNQSIALVGDNGAGKSTLVKLLLGLYTPTSGNIFINDQNIKDIDHRSLRDNISVVFQDYFNFEFSAAESIDAGYLSAQNHSEENMEKIRYAASKGGADDFIMKFPNEYNTSIGHINDGGLGLSGGQWQRIALSRAILRNPSLLILDEPTAALDPQGEAQFYSQLTDTFKDQTVVLISHRLGSARLADRIIFLKSGSIIEDGTHDELIAAEGEYAKIWEVQSQWYK